MSESDNDLIDVGDVWDSMEVSQSEDDPSSYSDSEKSSDSFMGEGSITQEDSWTVVSAYFGEKGLVRQQLDSFNEFIKHSVQEYVGCATVEIDDNDDEHGECKRRFSFPQTFLARPKYSEKDGENRPLYPNDARLRDLTYSSVMYVNIRKTTVTLDQYDEEVEHYSDTIEKVPIARIPIMVKSFVCWLSENEIKTTDLGECEYDTGGYFVVSGVEKVLIAQERMSNNRVYVFKQGKGQQKFSYVTEIRSCREGIIGYTPVQTSYVKMVSNKAKKNPNTILTSIPYIREEIPIAIAFRALAFISDKEILEHICYDLSDTRMLNMLRPSIEQAFSVQTRDVAINFIANRSTKGPGVAKEERVMHAIGILENYLLPHVGTGDNCETKKAYFLGYMVYKMLQTALGRRAEDDRDHYANKRLDLAGPLMINLFRQLFSKLKKNMKMTLQKLANEKKDLQVTKAIGFQTITKGLQWSLATGNWTANNTNNVKTGVSQVLNRLTFMSTLSHLRRCNTPIGRDSKLAPPRQLHNTHWGMVCPAETPEGAMCGIVKNLALMTYVSVSNNNEEITKNIIEFLETFSTENLEEISPSQIPESTKILLNGAWIGINQNPDLLVNNLRGTRRSHDNSSVFSEVSIVADIAEREIRIYTDAGRCCRPLYIVEESRVKITRDHINRLDNAIEDEYGWGNLLADGLIEYIDVEEEESVMIAMNLTDLTNTKGNEMFRYTHCEIHPSLILGICGSIIPFPEHNQSPRNTYQSAMGKQAIGVYCTNYQIRMDTMAHILYYPQKPLVITRAMEYMKFRELPSGQNVVAAVCCYTGYNQEDSLLMNLSAIDRGLFRSVFYRTYKSEESQDVIRGDVEMYEKFEKPNPDECRLRNQNYSNLEEDGLVAPGMRVTGDDILIGKTTPVPPKDEEARNFTRRDSSVAHRPSEIGIVDEVLITENDHRLKYVKVRVRSVRTPQIGDKFSSRHGQKGTVGMIYRQEDMPFTCEGISPDLILNPHAIPSRMTIGQLIECLYGKLASIVAEVADGTAFNPVGVTNISDTLHEYGYQRNGNEVLFNGHTGKKMGAKLFIGPTYYQRLKHLVEDKIFSRARGQMQILTRQPVEGRARGGGLRFGEMERDCMIAHGASQFMKERLFDVSDAYRIHVCDKCGLIAIAKLKNGIFQCNGCNDGTRISQVHIPYAAKLLFQELMAMNIAPRIITKKDEED
jgi:DNA-directed RNA polymerase II subunit RPB2